MASAVALMSAGGAMVKLEGAGPMIDIVAYLADRGVPVCGHLGLTPQSVHQLGGFKVQARDDAAARRLLSNARALQDAGAQLLVLECVPSALGREVSTALAIPVIGIGAGAGCDGQVLVMHDMLGINHEFKPRFLRQYADLHGVMTEAVQHYIRDVKEREFPGENEQY
jgi:3-methyl-2-oxobutanoate hydroxymethyltransferase